MVSALVITAHPPQLEGIELSGTALRFRRFAEAICEIVEKVDFLHFVGDRFIAANPDIEAVSARQSALFGRPVVTHLVGCQWSRQTTFVNHYLSGIASVYEQDEFYWLCGSGPVDRVGALLKQAPDIVFVHRLPAMLPILRSGRRPTRMFFDLDDIEHRKRVQESLQPPVRPGKLGQLCQIPALAAAERSGAALSRMTFVCSEIDRRRLRRLGFPRVAIVPNTLPIPPDFPELPTAPTILFLGTCWYQPNFRAAERLVRRIFPRVRAAVPEARLLIAGPNSLNLPSRRDLPEGVEYLGYVDDLTGLYASTRLVCCPITGGSGTRTKLIEAASYARPMVATRFAAEGLDFRDDVEILLRDTDDALADACVKLLRDGALCRVIGTAARDRMRRTYDASAIRKKIVQMISEAR